MSNADARKQGKNASESARIFLSIRKISSNSTYSTALLQRDFVLDEGFVAQYVRVIDAMTTSAVRWTEHANDND